MLDTDPAAVRADAYDMVINGVEVGGGSIRIHDAKLQAKMFEDSWIHSGRRQRHSLASELMPLSMVRLLTVVWHTDSTVGCLCLQDWILYVTVLRSRKIIPDVM